ncbi:hypothetical protein TeGR_g8569 [Tetraparma gracilis]|uniref:Calmodulin n=1 Tax=Tetraparma gracilis TaxID=2962635 RepID=A0ABQ6MI48_9STRA|nr:hypothetical protein TeGR_g8569 [Tetraparma gracilis]
MPLDPSEFFNELEVDEFREIFDLFDSDGGGSIDASELGSVMRTLGKHPSEEELVKLVKQIDEDGSGEIEFDEFLTLLIFLEEDNAGPSESQLRDMFNKIDLTHKGWVTNGEVSLFFGKLAAVGGTFLSDPGYDNEENLDKTRLERAEPWTDANNKAVMNFANGLGKNDRGGGENATVTFEQFCRMITDIETIPGGV